MTTPASSIDLTSKSVHYLSLPILCRIFLILDKLKIEMTKDSLQHAAKNGEHSCVENKLSCTHQNLQETQHLCHSEYCLIFVGPEHQFSKIYHAFNNYVKTTFNNGLSLSEVDLIHLETTNHGSNLMEVERGRNIDFNYTSTTKYGPRLMEVDEGGNIDFNYTSTTKHGPRLMEVDWGGDIDPNCTSSGCMLMQVDWGGKLRVNHINEYMPLRLIGELMKPIKMDTASLKLIGEIMIQLFTLWMDAYSLKLIGEPMIQVSSSTLCTLIMMQSQRISSLKHCGEALDKEHLPPLSWST